MPGTGGFAMTNQVLFLRSLLALAVGSLLVVLAYYWVDRQAAEFVKGLDLERYPAVTAGLRGLTYIPAPGVEWLAAPILVLAGVRLSWGPLSRPERAAFAAALSLLVAICFKEYLKHTFGRAWPATWIGKPPSNPSLLGDAEGHYAGTYGFFFFHGGQAFESFPSGHTTRIVAFLAVFWVAYPRGRWLYVLVVLLVAVGLVGMNYHFVGDVVGGAVLGGITGAYAARFAGLGGAEAFAPAPRHPGYQEPFADSGPEIAVAAKAPGGPEG
jgi:membrane-associated phospholipid phosphatase